MENENKELKISGKLLHEYETQKSNPVFMAFFKEYNVDENSENFKEDLLKTLEAVKEYNKAKNTKQFKAISDFFEYDAKKPDATYIPGILSIYKDYEKIKDDRLFKDIALNEGLKENRSDYGEKLVEVMNKYYSAKENIKLTDAKTLSTDVNKMIKEAGMAENTNIEKSTDEQFKELISRIDYMQSGKMTKAEKEAIKSAYELGKDKKQSRGTTVEELNQMIDKAQKRSKNNSMDKMDKNEEKVSNKSAYTWDELIDDKVNIDSADIIVTGETKKRAPKEQEVIDAIFYENKDSDKEFGINAKNKSDKTWENLVSKNGKKQYATEDMSEFFNSELQRLDEQNDEMDEEFKKSFKEAHEAHKETMSKLGNDIDIKFNANLGVYQLYTAGKLIKNETPKEMSFFERRKFIKTINEKDGKFHSYKDVGKFVDPNVYELLKYADKNYPLDNGEKRSVEYLRALKDESPKSLLCKIEYDLRGIKDQKDINFIEKARIKNFAKQHEEMKLAEVERDPKRKVPKALKRVAAVLAGVGIAIGGMTFASKNEEKLLDEGQSPTISDTVKPNEEKEEIKNDNIDKEENTNKNTDKEEIETVVDTQEQEIKQDLSIGKEVTVDAKYLYSNCEGATPKCDLEKFMENNPGAKFTIGRMAVKDVDGYKINTTESGISLDELKEKYGEDAEYFCNFKVEVPNGTYVDIGWTSVDNVKVKEQEKEKQNKWQLDEEYVKATNEVGRSGASKQAEDAVKTALKDAGHEVEF